MAGGRIIPSHGRTLVKKKGQGGGGARYIEADTIEKKKELLLWKPLNVFSWAKIIQKRLLLEHQIYFPEGLVYEDNYWHVLLHIYADHIYRTEKRLYHYFMRSSSTVHVRNDQHHLDRITVQLLKWKEYEKRGFLQTFHGELEYDFLFYAVHFIKTLVFRYDQQYFSHYRLQQDIVRPKISADIMEMYKNACSCINCIFFDASYHS
ncbi:MAG: hypothetical protein K2N46_13775, partial [Lachnospiraceae bacterium]|nr:hypothetical protein [Lachnospiraceae bacterium]